MIKKIGVIFIIGFSIIILGVFLFIFYMGLTEKENKGPNKNDFYLSVNEHQFDVSSGNINIILDNVTREIVSFNNNIYLKGVTFNILSNDGNKKLKEITCYYDTHFIDRKDYVVGTVFFSFNYETGELLDFTSDFSNVSKDIYLTYEKDELSNANINLYTYYIDKAWVTFNSLYDNQKDINFDVYIGNNVVEAFTYDYRLHFDPLRETFVKNDE